MKMYLIILSFIIILTFSCEENIVKNIQEEKGGICLTFDDTYSDEWYNYYEDVSYYFIILSSYHLIILSSYHLIILSFIIILTFSCEENIVKNIQEEKGGICLTFDDTYSDEWYKLSDLLIENEINATFFVTMINSLSSSELKKIQLLDSLHFEIGCHGFHHIDALVFLESHTLQEYYNYEVLPALSFMNNINLFPKSYSYPYGMNNDSLDNFLLDYFYILRDVTDEQRKTLTKEVDEIDEIFCKKGESNVVSSLGIDINFKINENNIRKALLRAKEKKEVVIFYAHCPVDSNAQSYQIEVDYLESLISLVKEYDLETYTISELVL